jgi:hypothetical protein
MRSLLEKAIVHLLNEDNDAAVSLFHQFMVERARQIHNSLRQGDEVVLSEGWNDEIDSEQYFADGDLEDLEDHPADGEETDGDMSAISGLEGSDDVAGDDMGDMGAEGDMEGMDVDGEEDGSVSSKLDDIEDQLEALTREFEAMMAEIDGDEGEEGAEGELDDLGGDFGDEGDVEAESDTEVEPDGDVESEAEETVGESAEMDEDEALDDITESVIAELEKVLVGNMTTDGEEVGDGGKIKNGNDKSTLTQKKANADDANPKTLVSKQSQHTGYERETPSVTPKPVKLKSRQKTNDTTGKAGAMKSVPKGGDSSALLNKDFAGIAKKNTKSVID